MEFIKPKSDERISRENAAAAEYGAAERGGDCPERRDCAECAAEKSFEALTALARGGRPGRYDDLKLAVETLSGGANTVLIDDAGFPSIMVGLPKQAMRDLFPWRGDDSIHPAWVIDGHIAEVIYVSKYMNCVADGRAYSLPMRDPHTFFTFDDALGFCESKGAGWHLLTNLEWMAIAAWSKQNGTRPRGNTGFGFSHAAPHEKGIPTAMNGREVQRTASGSGPASWNHNGDPSGIADLVGNMFEWVGGLRLLDGEIQVTPNDSAALGKHGLLDRDSRRWRAITAWGDYAAHGERDTFKLDSDAPGDSLERDHLIGAPVLTAEKSLRNQSYTGAERDGNNAYLECDFASLAAREGVEVPDLLRTFGVFPERGDTAQDGILVARNYGERIAVRGGKAGSFGRAGLNALHFYNPRTYDGSATIGFRCACAEPFRA